MSMNPFMLICAPWSSDCGTKKLIDAEESSWMDRDPGLRVPCVRFFAHDHAVIEG